MQLSKQCSFIAKVTKQSHYSLENILHASQESDYKREFRCGKHLDHLHWIVHLDNIYQQESNLLELVAVLMALVAAYKLKCMNIDPRVIKLRHRSGSILRSLVISGKP